LKKQTKRNDILNESNLQTSWGNNASEMNAYKAMQARTRRNKESGLSFEEKMFQRKSRYLVLFLTFNYRPEYREQVNFKTIQAHRDTLLKYMECSINPLLSGIEGCIWHLEEGGRSGGLHLHLLIFYSAESRADVWIAQGLGEYWVNVITRGWGDYWNSNANKERFELCWGIGIGQVNRHDIVKRGALQNFIINYLAKNDQIPSERSPDDKLFGARILTHQRL
jgi:hypothetical protein